MTYNEETGILILDEFEVHDFIATLNGLTGPITFNNTDVVQRIVIVPNDPNDFGPELVTKWEQKLFELLTIFGRYDREWHEDAMQTCG